MRFGRSQSSEMLTGIPKLFILRRKLASPEVKLARLAGSVGFPVLPTAPEVENQNIARDVEISDQLHLSQSPTGSLRYSAEWIT